ncbi:MAG: NYN domain-containing protein [Candidatus Omnitrophica bacterium]|nr:NYN domain-containing protein [Candidatus Omnitrophota bacterium]MCM8826022.1 NYN domain-containing protein [Candidatus Omnitrophota bacterium]
MLWYIIDGWNVVHSIPSVKDSPLPIRDLIFFIRRFKLTGSNNNKVTIVFDGYFDTANMAGIDKSFEVIFSGDKSADEIIKDKVRNYKKKYQIVMVSNDNQIIDYVKIQGVTILRVNDFLNKAKKKRRQDYRNDKCITYKEEEEINSELRKIWL